MTGNNSLPQIYGYYRTHGEAEEDARDIRLRGFRCRVINSTGTRARRKTYDRPWRIEIYEKENSSELTKS